MINVTHSAGTVESEETGEGHPLSLWWAPLDLPVETFRRLTACLSEEERHRAAQYRNPVNADSFSAARGWLRHLLGHQLECPPNEVRMITGEHGKPRLVDADLRFNASRSSTTALYVTSPTREVGVDIEAIRSTVDVDLEAMAAKFFSAAERAALASLVPGPRLTAAFQCWTRKEAYVKAVATGLTVPIDTIEVGVEGVTTVSDWAVHQVDVAPGFAAAFAAHRYEGPSPNVQEIVQRF